MVLVTTYRHICSGVLAHQRCYSLFVVNLAMVLLSLTQHECTGLTVFGISVAESRLFHVRFTISGPDCIHSNPRPTHDSIVGKEQEGSVEFVVAAIGATVPTPTLKLSSSAPTGCHYLELSVHIYVFAHTKRYLTFDIFAKDSGLTHCKSGSTSIPIDRWMQPYIWQSNPGV